MATQSVNTQAGQFSDQSAANEPNFLFGEEVDRIVGEMHRCMNEPRNDHDKIIQAILLKRRVGLG
jgi:hypothetical protein